MQDDALADHLRRFGFSEKEVDTYLTILEHGTAKTSTIAEDADVSNRYVYNIVERFDDRDLVDVNDHVTPATINAKPPSEVVASLRKDLESIEPELESRFNQTSDRQQDIQVIKSRSTVHNRIADLIDEAEDELTLSVPASVVPKIRDDLTAAVDRGVLALVLVTGVNGEDAEIDFDGIGNVVRVWSEKAPMLLTIDRRYALFAPNEMLSRAHTDHDAISLVQDQLVPTLISSFLGNYWQITEERWVADPAPLPREYRAFWHAVLDATLHLRADRQIDARVETKSDEVVRGRVVEMRQGLVEPATSRFPIENSIVLETSSGEVTIGGVGAFIEDYAAETVVLTPHDEGTNDRRENDASGGTGSS